MENNFMNKDYDLCVFIWRFQPFHMAPSNPSSWRDTNTLRRHEVFEDHFNIIAKAKRCLANTHN